jgi:hypothetical protein
MRHFAEVCLDKQTFGQCVKSETLMTIVLILILIHMPIIFYQLYAQLITTICGCKKSPRDKLFDETSTQNRETEANRGTDIFSELDGKPLIEV